MKAEQIQAIESMGEKGAVFGELWNQYFKSAFFIHGHICGGMPLGFRAGVAALKALGEERELNMAKVAWVETGTGHAAGCFADGVQMSTGCTFGKGLIQRTEYGKWAAILADKASRKAVRVSVRPEVMEAALKSPFVKMRHAGTPPTEVPLEISRAMVESVMARSEEDLFVISVLDAYPFPESPKPTFNTIRCAVCNELVAENKLRVKDGRNVCIPCSGYEPRKPA